MKHVDLCCGIGGFSFGLSDCTTILACDIDKHCRDTYEANFGIKPVGDIFDLDPKDISDCDIITAGFPCQPFSIAGLKKGAQDERFNVYTKIIDIIRAKKPKVVILENVANLKNINKGEVFKGIQRDFKELGYNFSAKVLNASDYGLPQNRARLIMVAMLDHTFNFDDVVKKPNVTLNDFIDLSNNTYRNDDFKLLNSYQVKTTPARLRFCGYKLGTNFRKNIPPNQLNLSRSHQTTSRVYHTEGVSPTLITRSATRNYIYDGRGIRAMTLAECYAISGFPSTFKIHASKTAAGTQLGNAVPPALISAVYDAIKVLV